MRALAPVAAALLLAGCTASFPEGSRIVAALDVGTLGAGDRAAQDFTLAEAADFLAVGYRTGPGTHVHLGLRAPNGTLYDTSTVPGLPCVVRPAPSGAWGLEVWADPFDGELRGGRFTVRAAAGAPPATHACANDVFPAQGRNVTLLALPLNLSAGEARNETFEQPWDLAALATEARGDLANATVLVAPPGGEFAPPGNVSLPPAKGTWRVRVAAAANETVANATLAIAGIGA